MFDKNFINQCVYFHLTDTRWEEKEVEVDLQAAQVIQAALLEIDHGRETEKGEMKTRIMNKLSQLLIILTLNLRISKQPEQPNR